MNGTTLIESPPSAPGANPLAPRARRAVSKRLATTGYLCCCEAGYAERALGDVQMTITKES